MPIMSIIYELNPPRFDYKNRNSNESEELYDLMLERISNIVTMVDGIHITDAVLGTKRLDVVESCIRLRQITQDMKITMSLRTRDRTFKEIANVISKATQARVSGILLVRGDPPQYKNARDSKLYPGSVLCDLHTKNLTHDIDMLLSLSLSQSELQIQKKIKSQPDGFITQVVSSVSEAQKLVKQMSQYKINVTPCIMLPSQKNLISAQSLGLDWSSYEKHPIEFIKQIEKIAGSVLITSPNDRVTTESTLRSISMTHQDDGR